MLYQPFPADNSRYKITYFWFAGVVEFEQVFPGWLKELNGRLPVEFTGQNVKKLRMGESWNHRILAVNSLETGII